MKRFLSTREDSQFALAQFARVENVVGNKKGKYAIIKRTTKRNISKSIFDLKNDRYF